jgi:hypothetical protein
VARKRQARRCHARRSDKEPCKAYAILGGTVCAAHGGNARRVRHAAAFHYWHARLGYAYDVAYKRWRREAENWQVRRILAAASILGISPERVTPGDLLWLGVEGRIPGEDTMPQIRVDRRYGPRTRAQLATRAARQAARKAAATAPDEPPKQARAKLLEGSSRDAHRIEPGF